MDDVDFGGWGEDWIRFNPPKVDINLNPPSSVWCALATGRLVQVQSAWAFVCAAGGLSV